MSFLNLASPQALRIYSLVLENGSLTAREIGERLAILPNTVYRANKQLLDLGVMKQTGSYPVRYEVVRLDSALGWFSLHARQDFKNTFGKGAPAKPDKRAYSSSLSFIKTRTDLLKRTDQDVATARHEINFIVSGLEVPDTTILTYRKAIAEGTIIRALVQKRAGTSTEKLEKWKDIGVLVRHTTNLGIRLFVIDSRIVYFTAYSEEDKEQAFGVRFEYPNLALFMNQQFMERWAAVKRT